MIKLRPLAAAGGVAVAVAVAAIVIPQMGGSQQLYPVDAAIAPGAAIASPLPIPPDPTPVPVAPDPGVPQPHNGASAGAADPPVPGPSGHIMAQGETVRGKDSAGRDVISGSSVPGSARAGVVQPPEPPAGGPCSVIPNWTTTKAAEIIADKRAHGDTRLFAYKSDPINIKGPGTYLMDFGPLDPDSPYLHFPPPVSTTTPPEPVIVLLPDDFGSYISYGPTSPPLPTTIIKHGAPYLEVAVSMSNTTSHSVRSCTGLVGYLD